MITLLNNSTDHYAFNIKVVLDISLKEFPELPDEAIELLKEATTKRRKVGCVIRKYGGNTYFTYDPTNQAQHEITLIAAFVVLKTDVQVTQDAGGRGKWPR